MSLDVQTNTPSLYARQQLDLSTKAVNESTLRLASGLRINSAKDDPAGIAIASRFTAQIRGYNQGTRNASDGVSMAQTAEGAMNEMVNNAQRIREVMVQALNPNNTSAEVLAIGTELVTLQAEIMRVKDTQFNGQKIIGSDAKAFAFQIGPDAGDTVNISTTNTYSLADYVGMTEHAASGTPTYDAASMMAKADNFMEALNTQRAYLGAVQNRFASITNHNDNMVTNLSDARGRIQDTDFASETAKLMKNQILQQAGISVLSQANTMPQYVLSLLN